METAQARLFIEAYGAQRLRIAGQIYTRPVLIAGGLVHSWAVEDIGTMTMDGFGPVIAAAPEVLLIGCGARAAPLAKPLRTALREAGIVADVMDTGAACRTFNVLVSEDRRVAAALIPL